MNGPVDPEERARWRAARARVARHHHPDLGGDPDEFIAALAEVDAQYALPTMTQARRWTTMRRRVKRQVRQSKQGLRTFRSRLPKGMPGSRRYFEL